MTLPVRALVTAPDSTFCSTGSEFGALRSVPAFKTDPSGFSRRGRRTSSESSENRRGKSGTFVSCGFFFKPNEKLLSRDFLGVAGATEAVSAGFVYTMLEERVVTGFGLSDPELKNARSSDAARLCLILEISASLRNDVGMPETRSVMLLEDNRRVRPLGRRRSKLDRRSGASATVSGGFTAPPWSIFCTFACARSMTARWELTASDRTLSATLPATDPLLADLAGIGGCAVRRDCIEARRCMGCS